MKRILLLALLALSGLAWAQPSLTANNWAVVEMKSPTEVTKLSGFGTNLNFLAGGKWEFLHSNGTAETGTYTFKGGGVHMLYDSGELFGDYQVTGQADRVVLVGTATCKGWGYTMQPTGRH